MSAQKQDHPSIKVLISGTSGSGKSTLLEKLIRREKAKWQFIYDHKEGDFARRFNVRPCFDLDELSGRLEELWPVGGSVIFNPSKIFAGKPEAGFAEFCQFLCRIKAALPGKKMLIADELDALVDNRCEPEALTVILDQGRTFQLDCYFIAQATNGIHNQVRKQIREIFVMLQGTKNGTEWLEEKGFSKPEIDALKHGQWLYKNLNTGTATRGGKAFIPKNAERDLRGL